MNRWWVLFVTTFALMGVMAAYETVRGGLSRMPTPQTNLAIKPTCSATQILQWDDRRGLVCIDEGAFVTVPEGVYTFETSRESLAKAHAEGFRDACLQRGGVPSVCESTSKDYAERKAGEK